MSVLREIIRAARAAGRAVLATVVKVDGSAYRRPGARMLFPEDGPPVGMVSGGCLEGDLAERARAVLASGESRTVVYDMRSPDDIVWGLGLGCNGEVRVLLERMQPDDRPDWLTFLEQCSSSRKPGVLATVFDADGSLGGRVGERLTLATDGSVRGTIGDPSLSEAVLDDARKALAGARSSNRRYEMPEGCAEAFVEFVPREISLLILGAGSDALPLVRFAHQLGWRTTVADDRPAHATPERFPQADRVVQLDYSALDEAALTIDSSTPAVVMTHHFLHDLDLLQFLLPSDAPYVGVLGPRQRTEKLVRKLSRRGLQPTAPELGRLYGPVGIDIGSETPEEIALAVLAEIRAVLSGRDGGFLRDRRAPLHEWPP